MGPKKEPLFEWADSLAAKHGRRLEEVKGVSIPLITTICFGLGTWYLRSPEGTTIRLLLLVATVVAAILLLVAIGTRAFQSDFKSKRVPIALHVGTMISAVIVVVVAVCGFLASEQHHLRDHKEEMAWEERCERDRQQDIEKAKKVQSSTRKGADECQKHFQSQILPLESLREHCKPQLDRFEAAKSQLAAANAKICSTASLKETKPSH